MRRDSFTDVLDQIRAKAAATGSPVAKLAAAPTADAGLLRKAASLLREHQPPAITYGDLYAVQDGSFELPPEPCAPASYGEGPGAPLRKVAHLLRVEDFEERIKVAADSYDTLTAAHGLTLLAEQLRSF